MLLAYIDEIGEPGAFIARDHPKYNTSPGFGYAGFVIPEEHAREFGSIFTQQKRNRFKGKAQEQDIKYLEVKGSELFRGDTPNLHPEHLRFFCSLVNELRSFGGHLFYYVDEKELGTPKQTQLDVEKREADAMKETLNRLARHAESKEQNLLVTIDSINEKQRAQRVARMYQHIFSRSTEFEEMLRLLEAPMHLDSKLSSNIQFADWVAGYLTRALDRQLIEDSNYMWIGRDKSAGRLQGSFTYESKLHFFNRSVKDIHHWYILAQERPLYPPIHGQKVGDALHQQEVAKIFAASRKKYFFHL
ncbi:DUF3800 domain-containing protein [Rothia nasisuis]|uniref:DUF3800 domain-containing protein n=1 Tax=Rothia nasisuis TaxID=2109647 RepID=UPI001F2F6AF6|nr:DUF3800 domain-containing protein [Rothia nasisuis]